MPKLLAIVIQPLDFDEAWGKFVDTVSQHFKFKIIFPEPQSKLGE